MVVSIALLGFAASGSFLNLFPRIRKNRYSPFVCSILFSVSVVISFYISDKIEMDPYKIVLEPYLLGNIALYYILLSIPFLFAGFCISILLSQNPKNAGTLYGFNLAGSAVGCLFIFAFPVFGSKIILFPSLLGIMSSVFFALRWNHRFFSLFFVILFLILPTTTYQITMSPYKSLSLALNYPEAEILQTEWNTISRVDIVRSPLRNAPGLSLKFTEALPPQLGLTVDGDTISSLTEPGPFIEYLPTAAAYLHNPRKVLVINPQGLDIAVAKHFEADITVAEGNPLIIESSKEFSRLYDAVHIALQDGRSFLSSHDEKYDIIQISLSESLFSSSIGLYGFNESYIFTKEGFQQYYAHLTDDGILLINRWLLTPPRELPKLVSIITDVVENPEEQLIILRTYSTTTVLLKKTPFTSEIADITKFCQERGFDLVWAPGIREDDVNLYNQFDEPYFYNLVKSQLSNNSQVQKAYLFNIKTPTDDQPFFFNFFQWRRFSEIYHSLQGKWQPFFEGGFVAVLILIQAAAVSLLLIVAPLRKFSVKKFTFFYFGFIGLAFMFVEISVMQQLILFLGQPTYSVTLVLFSLLLFSGMGSHVSRNIPWKRGFFFVGFFLFLLVLGLSFLIHVFLGLSLYYKILVVLGVLAPLSFFMGMPFPTAIADLHSEQIPYAWCVNGCASVLGSVLSVIVALSLGFRVVLLLGLLCYGLAFVVRVLLQPDL
jgi:hypothetical protein